jgi:hypothetical protein
MVLDDVFIAIVVGGIGLSIAYLVAEYLRWRTLAATGRHRDAVQRELHAARLAQEEPAPRLPNLAACEEIDESLCERRTARLASQRPYPFVDRRKRPASCRAGGSVGRSA